MRTKKVTLRVRTPPTQPEEDAEEGGDDGDDDEGEDLMSVDEEPKVSSIPIGSGLSNFQHFERVPRAVGGQRLPRRALQESGRSRSRRWMGLRSAMPHRRRSQTQETLILDLRCVTALSIDLGLTSDGSAGDARIWARFAW